MKRLPPPLLASFPPQPRRTLFTNSARWTPRAPEPPSLTRASKPVPGPPPVKGTRYFASPSVASPSSSSPSTSPAVAKPLSKELPYRFETGISLFAKRPPRPFPPPFLSRPSGSFSDPLSTDRPVSVNGELIKGATNGDDAVYASDYFVVVNDGVGAWATRPRGHAGLWARLILHYWAAEVHRDVERPRLPGEGDFHPDPIRYLQTAYERTLKVTTEPNEWHGTTTAAGAQLFYKNTETANGPECSPVLYVTNLGDSQVLVLRPKNDEVIYKSKEQMHWFDCPRQLGTNSPDTPTENAVLDVIDIEEGDVVLAMSDGVIDNLWSHEIVENVCDSLKQWEGGEVEAKGPGGSAMEYVAERLMLAAKAIALDPFAESPFMEQAIKEGLPTHGGKLDDISVVAAKCQRNEA